MTSNEAPTPTPKEAAQLFAKELLKSRTSWFFFGKTARNTKYPDGTMNPAGGGEFTAGGVPADQHRYRDTAMNYDQAVSTLYYAFHLLNSTANAPKAKEIEGATWRALPWIVVARCPSSVPGVDELVIHGYSASTDSRGSSVYTLIQRIGSTDVQKLFDRMKVDPAFFEVFYQAAFPGMDSAKNQYNGLYRVPARELVLVEVNDLEALVKQYPPTINAAGKIEGRRLQGQENFEFLMKVPHFTLDQKIGVGTSVEFPAKRT